MNNSDTLSVGRSPGARGVIIRDWAAGAFVTLSGWAAGVVCGKTFRPVKPARQFSLTGEDARGMESVILPAMPDMMRASSAFS